MKFLFYWLDLTQIGKERQKYHNMISPSDFSHCLITIWAVCCFRFPVENVLIKYSYMITAIYCMTINALPNRQTKLACSTTLHASPFWISRHHTLLSVLQTWSLQSEVKQLFKNFRIQMINLYARFQTKSTLFSGGSS